MTDQIWIHSQIVITDLFFYSLVFFLNFLFDFFWINHQIVVGVQLSTNQQREKISGQQKPWFFFLVKHSCVKIVNLINIYKLKNFYIRIASGNVTVY